MNDILSNGEKWGGVRRPEESFKVFREFVENNQLIDIGFEKVPWTYSNPRDKEGEVKERLNRVLCSTEWRSEDDKAKCIHIQNEASDHCMLWLDTEPRGKGWKKRFYFDKNWLNFGEVGDIVANAWGKQQMDLDYTNCSI
ncbi:uncharacterized protein [Coffea arabica]|uniref:Uncharacterized protein n=1 Tax=Coffea arabica TaxID=13443 RepID=A0ABM4VMH6_COFAR